MPKPLKLDPDRLFPPEARTRDIARALYDTVARLPIRRGEGPVVGDRSVVGGDQFAGTLDREV